MNQSLTLKGQNFMSADATGTEPKLQEYRDRGKDKEVNFIWEPRGKYSENL